MPLIKSLQTPNGVTVSFHKALRANYDITSASVHVDLASWPSEAAYLSGAGLTWMWPVDMAPSSLSDIDAALAQVVPFDGAAVVADNGESLEGLKTRQRAQIKAARDAAILNGFEWDGSRFDADAVSQQRIQGAVIMAMRNPTFSTSWTLFDNTTRDVSAADVLAIGDALAMFVGTNFAKGQELQAQLASATTADAIKAVVWTP